MAFEGETEVNDYMDTDGGLAVRFAVELVDSKGDRKRGTKTYDSGSGDSNMWYALMMGSSAFFFALAFMIKRDEKKEAKGEA